MSTTKMMTRPEAPVAPRPHDRYKQDLLVQIETIAPTSLLDLGCGSGALLRACLHSGVSRCVGVDPDPEAVAAATADRLDVRPGRAEALAFADRSFDVVTLDYVAHHIEHLQRALAEAIRVARRAVLVLDPWYDRSIASQRVAAAYDLWLKRVDRRRGLIHNPGVTAAQLAAAFKGRDAWRIDSRHRLILQPVPLATMEDEARRQLAATGPSRLLEDALETLLDRARRHGLSDDGAILFVATRCDGEESDCRR